jgi:hypothetical protein
MEQMRKHDPSLID